MTEEPNDPITPLEDNADDPDRPSVLQLDWERYGRYLEDSDLSDDDKKALIETLWSIMVAFVDLGFRVPPPPESCGEVDPLAAIAEQALENVIEYDEPQKKSDKDAGGLPAACTTGGDDEA